MIRFLKLGYWTKYEKTLEKRKSPALATHVAPHRYQPLVYSLLERLSKSKSKCLICKGQYSPSSADGLLKEFSERVICATLCTLDDQSVS